MEQVDGPDGSPTADVPFAADLRWLDGKSVVAVKGEVDLGTAGRFAEAVGRALCSGQRPVVIDLTETSFMDSTGLAVLVKLYREVDAKDGVIVRGAQPAIHKVLDLVGISDLITMEPVAGHGRGPSRARPTWRVSGARPSEPY